MKLDHLTWMETQLCVASKITTIGLNLAEGRGIGGQTGRTKWWRIFKGYVDSRRIAAASMI